MLNPGVPGRKSGRDVTLDASLGEAFLGCFLACLSALLLNIVGAFVLIAIAVWVIDHA